MTHLFVYEDFMGHVTHAALLRKALEKQNRIDYEFLPLPRTGRPLRPYEILRPRIPGLQRHGLDQWALRQMLYRGMQRDDLLHRMHPGREWDGVYIHTHNAGYGLASLTSGRRIASVDATWSLSFGDVRFRRNPLFEPALRVERSIFRDSDLIISFCDWAAESVINDYGIDAAKVVVIRNCTDMPSLPARDGHRRADMPVAGFVGGDFPGKGGPMLVEEHQKHFKGKLRLLIVTEPRYHIPGLQDIEFLPLMPREELLAQAFPQFDLFVHPTRYDTTAFVIIEAMSQALPVVASRVGAIPEMVIPGWNGLLFEPDDPIGLTAALDTIISGQHSLAAWGMNSRRHAEAHYNADLNIPRILDMVMA
ncbi:glycosyltransferase family 4 protein [Mobilicoccus sp.]|uniref:glycosyltransferase family 4 protein n=1 Tax=Mobilicoccus sp. TaxID=2034349 RepID=UPI0028A5B64D|nr:glycosyltransferase family 4 protein [Mobilicoccus sp.]